MLLDKIIIGFAGSLEEKTNNVQNEEYIIFDWR
jgi:hypothetical protein